MGSRVVCISRKSGAGGEDIGQSVAQDLGFRYVDEHIIRRAAQRAQVDPTLVAKAENRHPLLQRLLAKLTVAELASSVTQATGVPVDAFVSSPAAPRADAADLRAMIQAAIHEVAAAGQAVIVAHAASMALGPRPGVLRVLVTGTPESRVERLVQSGLLKEQDAAATIQESDRSREQYLETFYGVREETPTHYDLVINTDRLGIDQAVNVVIAAMTG